MRFKLKTMHLKETMAIFPHTQKHLHELRKLNLQSESPLQGFRGDTEDEGNNTVASIGRQLHYNHLNH